MEIKDWSTHGVSGRVLFVNNFHSGWGVIDENALFYFDGENRRDLARALRWLDGLSLDIQSEPRIKIKDGKLIIKYTRRERKDFRFFKNIYTFELRVKTPKNMVERILLLDEHVKLLPTHNDNVLLHNGEFLFDGSTDEIEIQGMLLKRNGKKYKLKYEQNLPD